MTKLPKSKTRAVGVSNFTAEHVSTSQSYMFSNTSQKSNRLTVNQNSSTPSSTPPVSPPLPTRSSATLVSSTPS